MTQFHDYSIDSDPFAWQQWPVDAFNDKHDLLGLGPWGPYSKRTFGLSYLPGPKGLRLDLVCGVELHRRFVALPHAIKESGYLPWEASSDFSHYTYRQQILPKDQLYADIHFDRIEDNTYEISVHWNNRTDLSRDLRLHLCLGMQAMATGSWQPQPLPSVTMAPSVDGTWVDSLDYATTDLPFSSTNGLISDGRRRCETNTPGFTAGLGLSWPTSGSTFACTYQSPNSAPAFCHIRYQSEQALKIELCTGASIHSIELPPTSVPRLSQPIPLDPNSSTFSIQAAAQANFLLDGFALTPQQQAPQFIDAPTDVFATSTAQSPEQVELQWPDVPGRMQLSSEAGALTQRRYEGDLEQALLLGMHNHVSTTISAAGSGHFHDFITPMFTIGPGEQQIQRCRLQWLPESESNSLTPVAKTVANDSRADLTGAADKRFGAERLAAVLQTNVVYPTYIKGTAIRHYPPGRWWDSLYTWDCGCIGLGLAEVAPRRAVELLNTYVTDPDDMDCAYIQHGSPVPVQHYLYLDLWQKTQDRTLLAYFYPRLSRYLRYLAGLDSRSPTRPFQNNLIASWDLFYNSGGWDDYPPQHHLLRQEPERRPQIAPMVVASHIIVAADIMTMAAMELGEDPSEWQTLSQAIAADIEAHAWDPKSQLYGYVEHDTDGKPIGLFQHPQSGQSFNQGLDGAMPAMTARIAPERSHAIWKALADEARFMTPIGLSTVDQSAPYYSKGGYWNGACWIPYQYFFWKAALDAGQAELAHSLAERVLRMYSRETEDSYCCFEHFMVESGRGAGWHHFGGLSAPILNLFAAYYTPGRITTGLRTWIHKQEWSAGLQSVSFSVSTLASITTESPILLVALAPQESARQVQINGQSTEFRTLASGVLEITLQANQARQTIVIQ